MLVSPRLRSAFYGKGRRDPAAAALPILEQTFAAGFRNQRRSPGKQLAGAYAGRGKPAPTKAGGRRLQRKLHRATRYGMMTIESLAEHCVASAGDS